MSHDVRIAEFVNDTRKSNPQRGTLIIVAMALDKMLKEDMLSDDSIDTIFHRMVHVFDDIDVELAKELKGYLQFAKDNPNPD